MVRLFQRAYNMESPMDTYFQCHFTKLVIKGPLNHVRSHKLLILEDRKFDIDTRCKMQYICRIDYFHYNYTNIFMSYSVQILYEYCTNTETAMLSNYNERKDL